MDVTAARSVEDLESRGYGAISSSLNLFSGSDAFFEQIAQQGFAGESRSHAIDNMYDVTGRIAGPLIDLPAGPVTLTASGEFEHETNPGQINWPASTASGVTTTTRNGGQHQSIASGLIEAQIPLTRADTSIPVLKAWDLEVSGRYDHLAFKTYTFLSGGAPASTSTFPRFSTFAYTVGTRFRPVSAVLFRVSYAIGFVPPEPGQLVEVPTSYSLFLLNDPKRGGRSTDFLKTVPMVVGGSPALRPERSQAVSAGAVVTPFGASGPRLSLDWTRIMTSREITTFVFGNPQYLLNHEAAFPGRITRAPLTASDIAKGYTGGAITAIDDTDLQVGKTRIDAFDLALDYQTPVSPFGRFGIHLAATWQPFFRRRQDPFAPFDELANHSDGPMKWRSAATLSWTRGPLALALSGRYYGRYFITPGEASANNVYVTPMAIAQQGSDHIPAQAYLDALATVRLKAAGLGTGIRLQFGVQNLMNHMPPLVVAPASLLAGPNYSPYGDPFGRSFRMSVALDF